MLPTTLKIRLIEAFCGWCEDQGTEDLSPHVMVMVDEHTQVPKAFVHNNQIILDLSCEATNHLCFEACAISFQARFLGQVHSLWIPAERIAAVFTADQSSAIPFPVYETSAQTLATQSGMHDKFNHGDGSNPQTSKIHRPLFVRVAPLAPLAPVEAVTPEAKVKKTATYKPTKVPKPIKKPKSPKPTKPSNT